MPSKTFKNYLSELLDKLQELNSDIENKGTDPQKEESKKELKRQIKKVREIIEEKNDTYLIKTKKGYLSANGKITKNKNLAYTFDEEEAVTKAKQMGGWLEEF